MRTYDDTFSGQKIYPGKVCLYPFHLGRFPWESAASTPLRATVTGFCIRRGCEVEKGEFS